MLLWEIIGSGGKPILTTPETAGLAPRAALQIAWIPGRSAAQARAQRIAPPGYRVVPFDDTAALLAAVASGTVSLTVAEAGGPHHTASVRAVLQLREAFPAHALVAWCDLRRIDTGQLLELARAGIQDIVREEQDELPHIFSRILATARQRSVASQIVVLLEDLVPRRLRPMLEHGLEHAGEHIDRDEFAAVFGMTRRTLHNRFLRAGLPSPRPFLTWCRLLVASALLEQPGHTLDSVAGVLDFPDGGSLGQYLRRYTGRNVTQLREGGILGTTIDALRSQLAELADAARAEAAAAEAASTVVSAETISPDDAAPDTAHSLPLPGVRG